jgi:hypothetical protein
MRYEISRHWRDADHEHIEVKFEGDDNTVTTSIAHCDFKEGANEDARLRQLTDQARRIYNDRGGIVVLRG